ncbi:hypothetical protein CYMTET_14863 [Cymbomonas tetramitiformis]|uniref:Uncharacterized protein n=1 Tax=Cymbomonas tetramitiformis TaxID=36881 RepID=A0AAE0L9R6_9CHLO|nr:hypothetical protein CYMTET_14863 [Cymbomonas tetramitiformis]
MADRSADFESQENFKQWDKILQKCVKESIDLDNELQSPESKRCVQVTKKLRATVKRTDRLLHQRPSSERIRRNSLPSVYINDNFETVDIKPVSTSEEHNSSSVHIYTIAELKQQLLEESARQKKALIKRRVSG